MARLRGANGRHRVGLGQIHREAGRLVGPKDFENEGQALAWAHFYAAAIISAACQHENPMRHAKQAAHVADEALAEFLLRDGKAFLDKTST